MASVVLLVMERLVSGAQQDAITDTLGHLRPAAGRGAWCVTIARRRVASQSFHSLD